MTLGTREIADLENDYRGGYGPHQAYKRLRDMASAGTVWRYYEMFKRDGVPRGPKRPQMPRRHYGAPPTYIGPAWIGEAIAP